MGLAACGKEAPEQAATNALDELSGPATTHPSSSRGSAERAPSTTVAERGRLGSGESVTLAFAGDASFQGLGPAASSDPAGLLRAIAPTLGDADVTMVNLETAVGSGGAPEAKAFKFQAPAAVLDALDHAGVDVVSMANNHGMDYGLGGLQSTLAIKAESKVKILGIGENAAEAYAPHIAEVRGQRIGFLALNDVFDASLVSKWTAGEDKAGIASSKATHADEVEAAVRSLRKQVDTLVVFLHFGTETQTCPNERQKQLVDQLSDSGADIIVGSHAHRLQGVGFVGDRLVAYGLGNFIFKAPSAVGRKSGVLKVKVTGRRIDSFNWIPAQIRGEVPVPLTGQAAAEAQSEMGQLQACAGVSDTPEKSATEKPTTDRPTADRSTPADG